MKLFTRTDAENTRKTLSIYRDEIRHEKKSFLASMIMIPVSNLLTGVLVPLFISFVVQYLIDGKSWTEMAWLFAGLITTSLLGIVANQIGFKELFEHEERVSTQLLHRSMQGLLSHSQQFFSNQKVGALANDINTFSRSYLSFMDAIGMQLSGIVVSYVSSLAVIAVISPVLLLPLGLLTAFVVWHSLRSISQRAVYRNKRKEMQSQLLGKIADVIGNQTLVRLFGKRQKEITKIIDDRDKIVEVASLEIASIQRNAKERQIVLFVFQILTMVFIVLLFKDSLISVGAAIFAITYLSRITNTMFNITSIIRSVEQSFLDAAKISDLLGKTPDIVDDRNARALSVKNGEITFNSVDFAYADSDNEAVFNDLNLTIQPGSSVGLVGKSGSGKTTLTSLLLRYADVIDGSISIDGQNISNVRQDSLRNVISYVPQDPYLFHRTLRDNIAYGRDNASDHDVFTAASQAHAMEFIDKMPNGLDTIVGERGIKLSGGQRQRIAIARAILKDAPILVLDEATSALDSESERLIQASLETLMKGRTSIIIAHRLSTIAKLDRIIVLENGQIIEDGNHKELLRRGGIYANLWKHQSGGFISEGGESN